MALHTQKVLELSVHDLCKNPSQPRRQFDEKELKNLAASIRENGMLQPISVRRLAGRRYEIIAGERRFRAACLANLQTVPCILLEKTPEESAVLALLENVQRTDLSCFEEAEACQKLLDTGAFTRGELAARLGKAPCTLSNKLRLLQFSEAERRLLTEGGLTEHHARALLSCTDENRRLALLKRAVKEQWTAAQIEAHASSRPKKARRIFLVRDVRIFLNTLRKAVAAMNEAGISAKWQTESSGGRLLYTVSIPIDGAPSAAQK